MSTLPEWSMRMLGVFMSRCTRPAMSWRYPSPEAICIIREDGRH